MRSDGTTVADSNCSWTKPANSQTCSATLAGCGNQSTQTQSCNTQACIITRRISMHFEWWSWFNKKSHCVYYRNMNPSWYYLQTTDKNGNNWYADHRMSFKKYWQLPILSTQYLDLNIHSYPVSIQSYKVNACLAEDHWRKSWWTCTITFESWLMKLCISWLSWTPDRYVWDFDITYN